MAQIDFKDFNKTLPKLRIPASTARYPWVTKAQTKWKPEGEYKVEQILDPTIETHAAFLTKLEATCEKVEAKLGKVKGKKANRPYADQLDEDENPTGKVVVKAMTYATDRDGNAKALTVVDGAKQPVTGAVYSGSVLICAVKAHGYDTGTNCGTKLYLNGVRVVSLNSGGGDADDLFDDDEDDVGYVAGPAASTPSADDGGDDGDADY